MQVTLIDRDIESERIGLKTGMMQTQCNSANMIQKNVRSPQGKKTVPLYQGWIIIILEPLPYTIVRIPFN